MTTLNTNPTSAELDAFRSNLNTEELAQFNALNPTNATSEEAKFKQAESTTCLT
ncbi:MAG: hypothetical protein OXR68_02455 [Alphaproteobacteria bacterium]|nr:hypothetical protein [Alphaproteobacteria bacterium]MDD9919470.1 hypothetical protein [Alphaproteobacteria bacterium]